MEDGDGLDGRLERALAERDEALTRLAEARLALEEARSQARRRGEPEPAAYPETASPFEPPPLRYRLADAVNGALKAALGPLHGALRRLVR